MRIWVYHLNFILIKLFELNFLNTRQHIKTNTVHPPIRHFFMAKKTGYKTGFGDKSGCCKSEGAYEPKNLQIVFVN